MMKVHSIIGIQKGCLEDIGVFLDELFANNFERNLCNEYEVPYDEEERKEYYEGGGDNEVHHCIVHVNPSPIIESLLFALEQVKGLSIGANHTEKRLVVQEFVAAMNRRKIFDNVEAKVVQRIALEKLEKTL
jgi:hypothetical protein